MRSKSSRGLGSSRATQDLHYQEPSVSHSGHPSWFVGGVGVAFCILFVIGVMTQIQTNEALVTGVSNVDVYKPNWAILFQPVQLVMGGLSSEEGAAVIVGWGIELIYLGCIVGFEIMQHAASRSGQFMAKVFRYFSLGIIGLNVWTDFQYGASIGGGVWGHVLFAVVTSFVVGFCGTIGMYFIEIAWRQS